MQSKIDIRKKFFSDSFLESHKEETKKISIVVVVHLIDTGIPYIQTLQKFFSLEYIIAKPKSINAQLLSFFPQEKIINFTKDTLLENKNDFFSLLDLINPNNNLIFLDIGGYFSAIANDIKNIYGNRFLGIIEDTENGYQKYKKINLLFPVISVAKSILKENEDYLVGQAVVFSTESLLREQGILLNNKHIGIIGIGKIGNGILSSLTTKTSKITIFDTSAVQLVLAYAKGANIANKMNLIQSSEIVFCATGNFSLQYDDFKYLKNGSFVVSVTSSDDELNLDRLQEHYQNIYIAPYITKYIKNGHYFFLFNQGNAINFLHGAVVDDFILLVQKEMIDSIIDLSVMKLDNKIYGGFDVTKERIADARLKNILHIST